MHGAPTQYTHHLRITVIALTRLLAALAVFASVANYANNWSGIYEQTRFAAIGAVPGIPPSVGTSKIDRALYATRSAHRVWHWLALGSAAVVVIWPRRVARMLVLAPETDRCVRRSYPAQADADACPECGYGVPPPHQSDRSA